MKKSVTQAIYRNPGNSILSFKTFRKNWELLLLALPAVIYFLVFCYAPMGGVVLAFKYYNYVQGIFGSKWVGFDNFKFFFLSNDALRITRNTLLYNAAFIFFDTVIGVALALMLYEIKNKIAIKYYQTTMILPHFLSWVIIGYISYALLNPNYGMFNKILSVFGKAPVDWYSTQAAWPFILLGFQVWQCIGLKVIMFYASIMGIDASLFEAAKIDGANKWQQIRYISIPNLVSIIVILTILAIGGIFRGDFGLFYQIPRDVGLLYPVTDVIDTYVYRGMTNGDIGVTSAVGLFQSFVGMVLVLVTNGIVKKISPEHVLF